MSIVPITYWTLTGDLYRLSRQPHLMRDKVFIGLPFRMKDDENILSRSYVVLRLNRFFNPHLKQEAARLSGIVTRTVFGDPDRNAGWHKLVAMPEIKHLRQNSRLSEAWTYMIIETVLRERPLAYLSGDQHLADFFAERFQLKFGFDLRPPLIRQQFHHHLLDRACLEASPDLKMDLAYRQQKIIDHMEGLQLVGETYMKAMMVLMGMLSGVTEIAILDIILEAFIGYITFMEELDKAEADEMITEDEAFGSWFSLVGVFLPFTQILPGLAKTLVDAGLTIVAVAAILLQIIASLLRAAVSLMEYIAADRAGFDSYGQYDPETTIFIEA